MKHGHSARNAMFVSDVDMSMIGQKLCWTRHTVMPNKKKNLKCYYRVGSSFEKRRVKIN